MQPTAYIYTCNLEQAVGQLSALIRMSSLPYLAFYRLYIKVSFDMLLGT